MSGKMIGAISLFFIAGLAIAVTFLTKEKFHPIKTKVELGRSLFFDVTLSKNFTMSCATCHDPEAGFVDQRETRAVKAVSLGSDGTSLGDRNTPTASYAAFSPNFHKNKAGQYVGGQFLDGREKDLAGQAGGPPTNPIEMALPDKAGVVARLLDNAIYVATFKNLYGSDIFKEPNKAYSAMANSIAAFEKTDFFAPFDSKYDRSLRGEVNLSHKEELGRVLFFSQQFTNCNLCHQLRSSPIGKRETFSNYEYHNIGVPVNHTVRKINGVKPGYVDTGLLNNKAVSDEKHKGKFKVPTLRNVAITGPYMHNGVFKDLKTVVLFYNKYNSRSAKRQINPETGKKFAVPEVTGTLSMKELETGPALKNPRHQRPRRLHENTDRQAL